MDEDLREHAGDGRRQLGVDLVGRDLADRLVVGDLFADGDEPFEDCALGHRGAELGHDDVDQGAVSR